MVQFQRHALREAPGIRKSGNPLTSLLSSMSPEKAATSIKEYLDGEQPPEPGGVPFQGTQGKNRNYLLMISISPFSPARGISSPELSEEALSPAPAPLPESAGAELIPSVLSPRSSTGTLSPP